ncbi:MAG: 30S ribosomal protein S6e [Euryarchaeota archaeon]|nr:30S ribosomal protein S6e [Euryarchaeota archaeon]|tara:strand:- start:783 stop:1262 length:480 start_codon:yes stop_codon:yes gene_type:complete
MAETTFVAVVNDTNPDNNGRSYNMTVSGNNLSQFLGKKIGDLVDGIFVGEGEQTLAGYKLEITGGSDKTGTPMRSDLSGGTRQSVLVTASTGFKGHSLVFKSKGGEKKRFRYKPDGMRKRRNFRGNTITQDTRQINLKVVEAANKSLEDILGSIEESSE